MLTMELFHAGNWFGTLLWDYKNREWDGLITVNVGQMAKDSNEQGLSDLASVGSWLLPVTVHTTG